MSSYPKPKAKGYHTAHSMCGSQIASSDALRLVVLSRDLKRVDVAFAAGISIGHLNKWMGRTTHLSPEVQATLQRWLDRTL